MPPRTPGQLFPFEWFDAPFSCLYYCAAAAAFGGIVTSNECPFVAKIKNEKKRRRKKERKKNTWSPKGAHTMDFTFTQVNNNSNWCSCVLTVLAFGYSLNNECRRGANALPFFYITRSKLKQRPLTEPERRQREIGVLRVSVVYLRGKWCELSSRKHIVARIISSGCWYATNTRFSIVAGPRSTAIARFG